jgi:hypothetical protein
MNPVGWEASTGGIVVVHNGNGPWGGLDSGGGINFISIQGSGASLKQTLTGLTVGAGYTVNFLSAHRPGYGDDETLHVNVDGIPFYESGHPSDEFSAQTATFTATATSHVLTFVNDSPTGDKSVFVDEISVFAAAGVRPRMCDGTTVGMTSSQSIAFGCIENEVLQCDYDSSTAPTDYAAALAAFIGCRANVGGGLPCTTRTDVAENLHAQGSCPGAANNGGGVGIAFHTEIPFTTTCLDDQVYEFRFHADYGRGGFIRFNDGAVGALSGATSGGVTSGNSYVGGDIWGYVEVNEVALGRGNHVFEALGFEGCCDGHSELDMQLPNSDAWLRVKTGAQADFVAACAEPPSDIASDLNGDGLVDVADLLLLLAAFGTSASGDATGDGVTDVADLLTLLAEFGTGGGR